MNNTDSIELTAIEYLSGYSEDNAFDLSSIHQDKFYYIIIGGIFMAIIICSCVCCLLIYGICIVKNSTKQIMNHQSLQNQMSVASKTTLTNDKSVTKNTCNCHCEIPTFQNPASESCSHTIRPSKIGIHDKMISNDWKLTVNDLHRFSTNPPKNGQLPLESDTNTNQASPLPVTPIPRELHEMNGISDMKLDEADEQNTTEEEEDKGHVIIEEEETSIDEFPTIDSFDSAVKMNKSMTIKKPVRHRNEKLDTMIENSLSNDSDRPWKYFAKYFEHSESKHSSEEKEDRAYPERDESEELDIIKDDLESTTITVNHENMNMILGPNMKLSSSKLDKLSIVNNINTMTNIDEYGIDELQIEFSMKSINSDDHELDNIERMILRKKYSSKSNSYFISMNKQPTTESQCREADENDDRYQSPKGSYV